jgi:predicted nuclease of predicted toxin-antitoxin system
VKLLLDEMYSPEIAEQLRGLGHDVISAQERHELESSPDLDIFRMMQLEQRVIVTNDHRHLAPLANAALQAGETFHGIVFTADRSLPRSKRKIPAMVELLDESLNRHRHVEKLPSGIQWLVPRP